MKPDAYQDYLKK